MRQITQHIIHCSASEIGDVKAIRHWHQEQGWQDVGYHFVIRRDGEIEIGRQLTEIGAHCRGHNQQSIGTCLIGDDAFNPEQFESLCQLHACLQELFPGLQALPHYQLNVGKTCPNFDIEDVLGEK